MWRQFRRTIPLHLDDPITCGNSSTRRYHYIWMTPLHVETVPHDNTITCGDSSTGRHHYMWTQLHRTIPLHMEDPNSCGGSSMGRCHFMWMTPMTCGGIITGRCHYLWMIPFHWQAVPVVLNRHCDLDRENNNLIFYTKHSCL